MLNDLKQPVNTGGAGIAQIQSVAACYQAIKRTDDRNPMLSGIAVFYGHSGLGKSVAASYIANKTGAYYVQAKSTYTKKALLQAVLREMGIIPKPTLSEMTDQAAIELAKSRRPLIVDEFDFLVSSGKVEVVRDLYEGSQGTILCIGEERLPSKLEKWERFHGRVLHWQPCPHANVNDARLLLPVYAPQIQVTDEVLELLVSTVRGSTRRISNNLEMLHEIALSEGVRAVDPDVLKVLLPAGFVTGESPKPRSL
jgi:chromosomal replication initiation ATPase DnaA